MLEQIVETFNAAFARAQRADEPHQNLAALSWVEEGLPRTVAVHFAGVENGNWVFETRSGSLPAIGATEQPVSVCFFWESIKEQVCIEGEANPDSTAGSHLSVRPRRVGFWADRAFRLHERTVYELKNEKWEKKKLYP